MYTLSKDMFTPKFHDNFEEVLVLGVFHGSFGFDNLFQGCFRKGQRCF